jgi:nicotinamidase-related amidase
VTAFPIVPAKTALLFFDTLNAYMHPEDPAAKAKIEQLGLIPAMQRMNAAARAAGIAVFYAAADHRPDHRDFAPHIVDLDHHGKRGEEHTHRTLPPPVSVPGPAREVIPELAPQPGDYIIKKHRWSTFFQTHFELSLRTAGIDTIMLAGGAIEVGIASTAYSARDLDFNQIVLSDAVFAAKDDVTDVFVNRVFPTFCRVLTVDQAIGHFERTRAK